MDKIDLPRGLIKYSTESQDLGENKTLKDTLLRTRVIIYAVLLCLLFLGFVSSLVLRSSFQVDVLRDRNALYRWSESNDIENVYQIKVMNKSQYSQQYSVDIEGLKDAQVSWIKTLKEGKSRIVAAGEIGEFTAIVTLPTTAQYQPSQTIRLVFTEQLLIGKDVTQKQLKGKQGQKVESIIEETRFWAPVKQNVLRSN